MHARLTDIVRKWLTIDNLIWRRVCEMKQLNLVEFTSSWLTQPYRLGLLLRRDRTAYWRIRVPILWTAGTLIVCWRMPYWPSPIASLAGWGIGSLAGKSSNVHLLQEPRETKPSDQWPKRHWTTTALLIHPSHANMSRTTCIVPFRDANHANLFAQVFFKALC